MTWTQPCCEDCWVARYGARKPIRVTDKRFRRQTCAFCGRPTNGGIFVRVDPATVRYPVKDE